MDSTLRDNVLDLCDRIEQAGPETAPGNYTWDHLAESVMILADSCHTANQRWWLDLATGEPITRNVGELLMLCVSELAEAMEHHRKGLNDDKLPHLPGLTVELADCLIRIFDLAGGLGIGEQLAQAFVEKTAYNLKRHDHTTEARLAPDGKKY